MAASLASVPELQKNACPPKLRSESALAQRPLQLGVPRVGHVDQLAQLLAHRLDHRRGQWPNRPQPQPGNKSR